MQHKIPTSDGDFRHSGEAYRAFTRIKYCQACRRYHPIHEFPTNPKNLDGLGSRCTTSVNRSAQNRRGKALIADPFALDRHLDQVAQYRAENPMYYVLMKKARYMEQQADKEEADLHAQGVTHSGRWIAIRHLRQQAQKLRREAGTPTGERRPPTTPLTDVLTGSPEFSTKRRKH